LLQALTERHYSVNFDESTVNGITELDINVSYLTEELLVEKRMLTSVAVQGGTSGEELAQLVLDYLKAEGVNPLKMMQIQTDGCSTMLGVLSGAQKNLRDEVPTLPTWGGESTSITCSCSCSCSQLCVPKL
jgi:hypothetical protein